MVFSFIFTFNVACHCYYPYGWMIVIDDMIVYVNSIIAVTVIDIVCDVYC